MKKKPIALAQIKTLDDLFHAADELEYLRNEELNIRFLDDNYIEVYASEFRDYQHENIQLESENYLLKRQLDELKFKNNSLIREIHAVREHLGKKFN